MCSHYQQIAERAPAAGSHLYSRHLPFLSPCIPTLPLWSISVYVPSLNSFFPFSQHPAHLWIFFLICYVFLSILRKIFYMYCLFTFHFFWRALTIVLVHSLSSCPPRLLKTLVVCLFCSLASTATYIYVSCCIFHLIFLFLLPISLLDSHRKISKGCGKKNFKVPQQKTARETISTRSGEITVAGSGWWTLPQPNRHVCLCLLFRTLCDSGHLVLIVIKMEYATFSQGRKENKDRFFVGTNLCRNFTRRYKIV